jgi:2'-5' RNA ligase
VLLTYLLSASINDNNSFVVKAVLRKALKDLQTHIEKQLEAAADPNYIAHLTLGLERMKEPEKAKPTIHKEIPPGAPIGCEE